MGKLMDEGLWQGKLYSGGWRKPGGDVLKVVEPSTGYELGEVGLTSPEDVERAARRAVKAQSRWQETGYEQRGEIFRGAAALLLEHRSEIAEWIVREAGSVRAKAEAELHFTYNEFIQAATLPSQPYGHLMPTNAQGRLSMAQRVPFGVVGVISPWNFPLVLAVRSVAPALALGNAVILKPDPQTAVCGGMIIAWLLEKTGLPEDLFHVLPGGAEVGEALVTDPNTAMISFTGSTTAGRRVGELAGKNLKKVSLELGGNNALIILDDADVEVASSAGAWGSFLHQGQVCLATSRHLVDERIIDRYIEALTDRAKALPVGDPYRDEVALGPLINNRQLERVSGIVNESLAAGANLATGATHEGLMYEPTVLSGVTPHMRAFTEEIFGPVAPVTNFRGDDTAVELANRTDYGLSAAVYTRSVSRGLAIAKRLRSGVVHINDQTIDDEAHVPFGGMGSSGNGGRFGGEANWEEFTQWQWLTLRDEARPMPF